MMRSFLIGLSFFFPLALHAQEESAFGHGGGLFPLHQGHFYTSASNPAFAAGEERCYSGLRVHDRYIMPELALQRYWSSVPAGKGNAQFSATHYGNRLFRKARLSIGYALPLSPKSGTGIRFGPAWVRIGEGHGQRWHWKARLGIRSRSSEQWRWELWIEDPHAPFRERPQREFLSPGIVVGGGRRWPKGNVWSFHLRKQLERPLHFRSRGRVRVHDELRLISGIEGPPWGPLFGWTLRIEPFLLRISSGWHPLLGMTPELALYYRSGAE